MKEAKEKGVRQCSLVGRERENETKEAERQKSGASKERQISDTKQKPLMRKNPLPSIRKLIMMKHQSEIVP